MTRRTLIGAVAMSILVVSCGGSDDAATEVSNAPVAVETTAAVATTEPEVVETTEAPTTTARPTTTTDPAATADLGAIAALGALRDGTAPDVVDSLIEILEPSPLERVDLISATLTDDGVANLVVVGTSGYGTPEFQVEAAIETLNSLSNLWEVPSFSGIGKVKVGLDLTVDGQQYLVPNESMVAVLNRQMTPQQALGLP
jgi:hypothetical protein